MYSPQCRGVREFGCGVCESVCSACNSGCGVCGSGCGVHESGCGVHESGCGVHESGCRLCECGCGDLLSPQMLRCRLSWLPSPTRLYPSHLACPPSCLPPILPAPHLACTHRACHTTASFKPLLTQAASVHTCVRHEAHSVKDKQGELHSQCGSNSTASLTCSTV